MLNHRITLSRLQGGRDALNQPTEDWVDLPMIWADVRFQSGAEVIRAGAEVTVVRISIRIRARADVTPAMRARYNGVDYEIKSMLPDDDRSFMFLVCEAVK